MKNKEQLVGTERPTQTLEQALQAEGIKIEKVRSGLHFPPLEELTFQGFEGLSVNSLNVIDSLAESCQKYLSGIIMTDRFTDHEARRAWRRNMRKTYGDSFAHLDENNKLRWNFISNIQTYLSWLVLELDKDQVHSFEADTVRELRKSFPEVSSEQYYEMGLREKLGIVKQVDGIAQHFLTLVAPHVDTAQKAT